MYLWLFCIIVPTLGEVMHRFNCLCERCGAFPTAIVVGSNTEGTTVSTLCASVYVVKFCIYTVSGKKLTP